jgi:hypothetical protein
LATPLPDWLGIAGAAAVAVRLLRLAILVSRSRGVCEYWTRSAMRLWKRLCCGGRLP